jgi:DNA-binding CsgD family transcriptional regulator
MSDTELLSGMIGDIYDAALDPALWLDVLEQCSTFVGGAAAALYIKDPVSKAAIIDRNYVFGIPDEFTDRYLDTYVKLDPSTTGLFFFGVGEVSSTADILPLDEFYQTRFFREWAGPQHLIDATTTLLERSTTSYAAFSVLRHERNGTVDDACRHRMRLLAPHIRRAVLIGNTLELKTAEAATLADAFDGLAAGMFLVDGQGHLVHANARGHVMLDEGSILRKAGGCLIAKDPAAGQALRAVFAAAATGGDGLGTQGIAVPLAADGHVAHVLPLTSGARRKVGAGYAAVAAVFVRKAGLDAPAAPELIAKLHGLTPSELRVLLAVFESGGVPNVAEALGISEATVKTHLRRLFEKTGTARQADLVKLVAGFAAPAG